MVKKQVKIIWDDEAKKSLKSIYNYIKNRESVETARKVRDTIVEQAKTLTDFPEKFTEEPFLKDEPGNNRFKVVWSYKIIYEVTDKAIYILDIFHTGRDPSNIKRRK